MSHSAGNRVSLSTMARAKDGIVELFIGLEAYAGDARDCDS
jgi:hypothetical protein